MEAVSEVIAVGQGLTGGNIGDIVAYAGNPTGAYTEEQIFPVDKQFSVNPSHDVLVHAAVSGVGSLFSQSHLFTYVFKYPLFGTWPSG